MYGPCIFRTSEKPELAQHHKMTDEEMLDLRVFSRGSGFGFNIGHMFEASKRALSLGYIQAWQAME